MKTYENGNDYTPVRRDRFILASLVLAHYHSPYWLWFTAFVGFNLLQSSFTNFCPLEIILKKAGVGGSSCCAKKNRGS